MDTLFPENLDVLLAQKRIPARVLISPVIGKRSYIYIRPPTLKQIADQSKRVVAYDDPVTHKQSVTAVLFADAHVELRRVDKKFWDLVKTSKEASEKAFGRAGGEKGRGK